MKNKLQNSLDALHPEQLLKTGIKTLSHLGIKSYSQQKTRAKEKSQITFIGEKKLENTRTQLYVFNEKEYKLYDEFRDFKNLSGLLDQKVGWLNVHGLHDVVLLTKLAEEFPLDRLTLRQLVDTTQRPKVEELEEYLFFSVKSILHLENQPLKIEQISFILSPKMVISFQEEVEDHFGHIRDKIMEGIGYVRKKEGEYLLVQLLDAILDNYFETIDMLNSEVSTLEQVILKSPTQQTLLDLEKARNETQVIKKSLTPLMEALSNILNDKVRFIADHNLKYFRDLRNSSANALEEIDATAKSLEGLTNIYFSSISHKMNETMKILTTVATIFIPLTFIVGIYGMNFQYMPELQMKYGYYAVWVAMIATAAAMLYYFKKRGWL
jgi:magnesium transporter